MSAHKVTYTGKQVREIWKTHEKFCKCNVCTLQYTLLEIDRITKMPDDGIVLSVID